MSVITRPDTDCMFGSRAGSTTTATFMDQVVPPGPAKPAIKLADLYRKAKAKGVLTSFTEYPT